MRMRGWRPAPEPTLPATGSRENMKAGEDARGARGEGPRKLGLCVLCGLPAAGKSTFARALSHQLRLERGWAAGVVAYDDVMPDAFLEKAGARPLPSQWKLLRQELLKYLEYFLLAVINGCQMATPPSRTEAMWEDFITCLKEQDLISSAAPEAQSCYLLTKTALFRPLFLILDDNFYYQSMRYEVYQLARKYSLGFCQLFLDCSLETCLQRNGQRPRPLPAETIHLMGRKIEEPNPEKNAWEHNSLTIQSPACASEPSPELTDLLLTALENPVKYVEDNVEQKETDRTICSTNILHQADQALRRIVSQAMKEAKGHLESKHVVLVRMWVDQSPQALLVGISDGTAALETACQFLQQLSVLLPWDPAILPLDEQVLPYNLKLLAEELNKLKAELLEDLREGNRKYLCFQQTIDVSDVISFFHYEKDNIVRKYFSKQH